MRLKALNYLKKWEFNSWANKEFQNTIDQRITELKNLPVQAKKENWSEQDVSRELLVIKNTMSDDCVKYLSADALERALDEGTQTILLTHRNFSAKFTQ